jgi:transposase-like protein
MDRRRFSREFKVEAVRLVKDHGVSLARSTNQTTIQATENNRGGISDAQV